MASPRATRPKEMVSGVNVTELPRNPFDSLPIESVQRIVECIDSDSALCAFQASCRSARDAVDGDNFSLWRRLFISRFEPTGWSQCENIKYKQAYHNRRRVLKNGATFTHGASKEERECLEMVRDLVVGAFADNKASSSASSDACDISASRNINRLVHFLRSTDLLTTIFKPVPQGPRSRRTPQPRPNPLLHAIRAICTPFLLSLEPHLINEHYGFPDSQQAVYDTALASPFFGGRCGLDIHMETVLHNISFWRYHMVRQAEQTLFTAFSQLSESERPQWWRSQLAQGGKTLGKHWKGSYAYLDPNELSALRERGNEDVQVQDIFAGEDAAFSFQDMTLRAVDCEKMIWPAIFERHLNSLTPPTPSSPPGPHTRAQRRSGMGATPEEIENFKPLSFRFDGDGSDSEESFFASGWLNPLPPQQGIPGWQRLTMMKYFEVGDEDDGLGAGVYGSNVDWDALWAYEGVVLPGGRIVVGRWWNPAAGVGEDQYSGPFILWCVDGADGSGEADADDVDGDGEEKV